MKLNVNGNINEYYVQTLCLLFFPGERFSKTENEPDTAPRAYVDVTEGKECASATVKIEFNGKSATKMHTENATYSLISDASRRAVGKAFFSAGKAVTGINPQWGILTGVRPAKIALRKLTAGETKASVKAELSGELFVSPKKAALVTDIAAVEKKIISKAKDKLCSVYISIPFCPTRCSYCSFISVASKKLLSMTDEYLDRLLFDIDECFDTIRELGLGVSTVYVGGGTPTTLDEKQLLRLMNKIISRVDVSALEEFTVEAGRPDTLSEGKLSVLYQSGVTRISVNPQTLNDSVLAHIGRNHTANDFLKAFEMAKKSGIKHINTDLIAGLPTDTYDSFVNTVDGIISLGPDDITVHTLCIKSAADLALSMRRKSYTGETSKCVDYSQKSLKKAGYIPYYIYRQKNTVDNLENVGYSLPGAEGLYNIYMMEEIHSIFAVGAGAVSKLVSRNGAHIERIFDYKYPYEYLSDKERLRNTEKRMKALDFYNKIW